jgi:hypothetical protein
MKPKQLVSAVHQFRLALGKCRHPPVDLDPRPARGASR